MSTEPNFANRTIWTGDNLDILRGLNSNCVDLIYLDPPFNSNRTYAAPVGSVAAGAAFKDTWTLSDLDVAWMGLIADEQPAVYRVIETAGLTHGKGMQSYLCMMAVRLLEMKRALKENGSIYLHCDSTASHYLKLLMDSIFGAANFRNEIAWKRTTGRSDGERYGRVFDVLLYYAGHGATWNNVYVSHDPEYVSKFYRHEDERGRFRLSDLTAAETRTGESGEPWRDADPNNSGRHWAVPSNGAYADWIDANVLPGYKDIVGVQGRLEALDEAGMLHWPQKKGGMPALKRYLDSTPGQKCNNFISDILPVQAQAKERIGYPTQKPLALLERIIEASSNPGDVLLDPFCGCATACVAAESLGRKWVGIDLSAKAAELVKLRLADAMGGLFHDRLVTSRSDIPKRTDIEAPVHYRQNKHVLFGQQEGRCNGCKMAFLFKVLEVDHVVPRSRGGTDHMDNLQLLCGHCNRTKGDRPQEYLVNELSKIRHAGNFT